MVSMLRNFLQNILMVKIKRQLIILRCYERLSRGGVICMYLEK